MAITKPIDYLKNKIKKQEKKLKDYKNSFLQNDFCEGKIVGKLEAYENLLEHIELMEEK